MKYIMSHQVTLINYTTHVSNFVNELEQNIMFLCKVVSHIDGLVEPLEKISTQDEMVKLLNHIKSSIITYIDDKDTENLETDINRSVCQMISLVKQKPIIYDSVFYDFCELLVL
jgi:hypothetical protein